ncbi:MAG: redoxin domain-containing protein [Planctomycetes bacterium]|nr:redoxin domain-containing protein [Planctomycetota bacterium]
MKTLTLAFLAAAMAAGLAAAQARAQGLVGKPAPEIAAQDWLNSPPLSLQAAKGKIVVVEFWATWCPPCRASIPHLIEMFKNYSPKGVVFMSLTDEPKATVEPFAKQMNMIYPVGCGSQTAGAYGVRGIPHAFIIDPSGNVAWAGHPMAGLDKALEAQLAKTPPVKMSAQDKAAAMAVLEKAEAAIKQEQYVAAAALLAKLARADDDPEVKARFEAAGKPLADRAAACLEDGRKKMVAKEYLDASVALDEAQAVAPGSEQATQAEALLKVLLEDPKAKAAIEQGRREREAANLAAEIEKRGDRDPAALLKGLDDLATRFPDTKAGKAAAEKAKALRADPDVMKKIQNDAAEKDCKGWMSMAKNFIKAGLLEKARPYLEQVVQKYPDSDYAKEAKELLQKMNKKD